MIASDVGWPTFDGKFVSYPPLRKSGGPTGVPTVPDHFGGRPWKINAWFLYTHMVYL
jgi:hypothetical protein